MVLDLSSGKLHLKLNRILYVRSLAFDGLTTMDERVQFDHEKDGGTGSAQVDFTSLSDLWLGCSFEFVVFPSSVSVSLARGS